MKLIWLNAMTVHCQLSVKHFKITLANILYFLLGSQPIWPSREILKEFQPSIFKELYPSVRVILDCTELKCQTPTVLLLSSQMYSVYKNHTTFKALVGITPYGAVSFLSTLYTGYIYQTKRSLKGLVFCLF